MAGVRKQLRRGDLDGVEVLNDTLKDLYLRIETLEARLLPIISQKFKTKDPIESSFPLTFASPVNNPAFVHVRIQNVSIPRARIIEATGADWAYSRGSIVINYISGLEVGTTYQMTVEVRGG